MSDVGETEQMTPGRPSVADSPMPEEYATPDRAPARAGSSTPPSGRPPCRTGTSSAAGRATIPIRSGYSGKYPVPGWDSSYDWKGFIDFDALPNMLNPDSGLVITANNSPRRGVPLPDPYNGAFGPRTAHHRPSERHAAGRHLDAAGLSASSSTPTAQTSTCARMRTGLGAPREDSGGLSQVLPKGWDFHDDVDSAPAAFFNASGATCRSRSSMTSSAPTPAQRRRPVVGRRG